MRADVSGPTGDQPAHPHASKVVVTACRVFRALQKIESGRWYMRARKDEPGIEAPARTRRSNEQEPPEIG
jgi:hypothetical protein